MTISEKGTQRLSLLITIIIHLLVLIIPLSVSDTIVPEVPEYTKVPVSFELKEEKEPKPKAKKGKPFVKKGSTKKASTGKNESIGKKQPGDRDNPVVASESLPPYPKDAINNGWEGTVKVRAKIDATGRILYAKVVSSSGHKILDETFLRVVKENYTFKPKRQYGKNETGFITIKYTYKL